mgnify:CR=1 FL=1
MTLSFPLRNLFVNHIVSATGNDMILRGFYKGNMTHTASDWFFKDWLSATGIIQARIVDETGWPKGKVSKLVNGKVPYNRTIVNTLCDILNIEPYELLMHPRDAMAMRQIRESVYRIAAEARQSYIPEPERDGTHG